MRRMCEIECNVSMWAIKRPILMYIRITSLRFLPYVPGLFFPAITAYLFHVYRRVQKRRNLVAVLKLHFFGQAESVSNLSCLRLPSSQDKLPRLMTLVLLQGQMMPLNTKAAFTPFLGTKRSRRSSIKSKRRKKVI